MVENQIVLILSGHGTQVSITHGGLGCHDKENIIQSLNFL